MCGNVRLWVFVATVLEQQFHHILVAIPRRMVQSGLTFIIFSMDIGLAGSFIAR